ncbi:hypothetical protein EVAR_32248_1 [Eumeta japonica]|uniref:Uncharacterized protein n=1 Tax=Eumeta variegata TaxID=151549 RepID=A0A4C1X1Y8_EUMVA|nr:hypothetical protein EVAR_32248_1 [Eumeta japonica]
MRRRRRKGRERNACEVYHFQPIQSGKVSRVVLYAPTNFPFVFERLESFELPTLPFYCGLVVADDRRHHYGVQDRRLSVPSEARNVWFNLTACKNSLLSSPLVWIEPVNT